MRRTLLPDGTILIESALRVEVHTPDGTVLSSRPTVPQEVAALPTDTDRLPPLESPS